MMTEILDKIKAPAIALIIIGVSNFGISILAILSGLLRLTGIGGMNSVPTDEAERMGFIFGTVLGYGIAAIGLIVGPIIAYGAFQMMKGKRLGFAKTSAILSIVPLISCCFLISFPFGIWALIVLKKPEVKSFFKGETNSQFLPPQPPSF